ncbi:flagellar hook-length control protein FliK [Marinobacter halophilus]|uniref:Flagellar hook-length control protein FliK n=2 Tax=Marinobacter halophilus TaxID=1323740 RepID=A0A2T1KA57_9GAMM|nr:flagellar hook-length control protein FliK [Marinobacter halophilus]PSF07015.1 flagellar hook-length control protein FliK [Marinobacter halophilus]GGC75409.1 flagellar protein [Marinobacter halophilus]
MQQTILPQASNPGVQKDVATAKTAGNRDSGSDSRFDQVSRAEQKRLEQKQSDRLDQRRSVQDSRDAKAVDQKTSEDSADSRPATQAEKTDASIAQDKGETLVPDDLVQGELPETASTDFTPMTFASLQSLIMPAGNPSPTDADVVLAPALAPTTGLPGLLNGQSSQQNAGGTAMTLSTQLTELLSAGVAGETSRPVDPASALTTPKFQATLELASQQASQPTRLAAEAAVPLRGYATSVDVPVGQAEWGDKVMGKLSWLTARNMSVAEIHLTPPDMGPMEVKVRVQNDQATVTVHAANPVVREQLELHSHRLRDMLGEQGLSLSQFDVSDQANQQAGSQGEGAGEDGSGANGAGVAGTDVDDDLADLGSLDLAWKGEVDIFA